MATTKEETYENDGTFSTRRTVVVDSSLAGLLDQVTIITLYHYAKDDFALIDDIIFSTVAWKVIEHLFGMPDNTYKDLPGRTKFRIDRNTIAQLVFDHPERFRHEINWEVRAMIARKVTNDLRWDLGVIEDKLVKRLGEGFFPVPEPDRDASRYEVELWGSKMLDAARDALWADTEARRA